VPELIAYRRKTGAKRLMADAADAFAEFRKVKRFWKSWPKPQMLPEAERRAAA
jgi:hypothetical protein